MQKRVYEKGEINKLFVVNKPMFISSNFYLNRFKRAYKNKQRIPGNRREFTESPDREK